MAVTEKNAISKYSKAKEYPPKKPRPLCTSSTIQPRQDLTIGADLILHAGTIVHVCDLEQGHEEQCACRCGHRWMKFKDVK